MTLTIPPEADLLVSLIGLQPIPNLLPIRYLQPQANLFVYTNRSKPVAKRLKNVLTIADQSFSELEIRPYDLNAMISGVESVVGDWSQVTLNLTGGTKLMAAAAYSLALKYRRPFVYLRSEGGHSILYCYQFDGDRPVHQKNIEIPAMITVDEYLLAHLPGYSLEGYARNDQGEINEGGLFERAIDQALNRRLDEVLAGVRPQGVARQIEIDLVIRCGNQVGIAELKVGGKDSGMRGLRQLKMAAEPNYLGAFTAQFLMVGSSKVSNAIETLARERGIHIIFLPEYDTGKPLTIPVADKLANQIKSKLTS